MDKHGPEALRNEAKKWHRSQPKGWIYDEAPLVIDAYEAGVLAERNRPFTPEQREAIEAILERAYPDDANLNIARIAAVLGKADTK